MSEFESFDNIEPIDLNDQEAPVSQEEIEKDPSKDTFDNGSYREEVSKDSQVKSLDDEDEDTSRKEDKEEEEPEDKKDSKEEKKVPEVKEEKEDGKEEEEPKLQGKTIKVKTADGKIVDIPEDGTIKVKVKGKSDFVSLQDLRDNYSGQRAWTEEIETAKSKQEEAEQKLSSFQSEKQQLAGHLQKIASMMDDENTNPLEAMNYLLDITGRDTNTYNKRIFDFMEKEVQAMSEMDEVERNYYWSQRELESIKSNQAAKADELKEKQAQEELLSRVNQLRESQGVSEDQFVDAHNELVKLGVNPESLTPELAVNYAAMKPFSIEADKIVSEYRDQLGDNDLEDLSAEVAKVLKRRPNISHEDALSISAKILGFEVESEDDYVDQLKEDQSNSKESRLRAQKVAVKEDPNHLESFDDFDY